MFAYNIYFCTYCNPMLYIADLYSDMSFPTANRGEARRAYINALRAADGLPPLPERPETTWRPVEPVAVALTSARPPVFVAAPEVAQGAVVSFFLFS